MICGSFSNAMADAPQLRALQPDDLPAYKALRDETLALHPEAFTSDAESERPKAASSYLDRLGLQPAHEGRFTLGAWQGYRLVGAITCECDARRKVRHIGHVVGMMVRAEARGQGVGHALVSACIERARANSGFELLTLSVTSTNAAAVALYTRTGFVRYGCLPHAVKLGNSYHDKDLMVLDLRP